MVDKVGKGVEKVAEKLGKGVERVAEQVGGRGWEKTAILSIPTHYL